jgi:hypothetical protein
MAAGFHLDLDYDAALARLPGALELAQRELDKAADRALRKTAQWLRTHSAREIGRELSIPNTPIKHRFSVYPIRGAREVKLWIGINPLSVHYLGDPRQTPTGVRVRRRDYEGAFISPMKSSAKLVWRRKGRERLPIERVTEEWGDQALTVIERWERRATTRFIEIFEQEARYALTKAAG